MIVVVLSSDDGPGFVPEVPAGTAVVAGDVVDPGPPAPAVLAGAPVVGGAVVLAVGGIVSAGTDELPGALEVALPGVVLLGCDWLGACAAAGRGVAAANAAQQIPAVRKRRRIRRHRLTETWPRPPTAPLTAARR
jgi:hypothetical protein